MEDRYPLSALLSQTLVAFTIEFDNEFEHLVPHRTTEHGSTGGPGSPWLVSMTMWLQFLRFVPDSGIDATDLWRLTGLPAKTFRLWLVRLSKWWSYVSVSGTFVRPTPGGRKALEAWRPLTHVIQKRWEQRLGKDALDGLLAATKAIVAQIETGYPGYLPILGYELLTDPTVLPAEARSEDTLPALLAKLLLAFAAEFERESKLSLAVSANVLRLIGDEGARVRDLPRLSGVSKEGIAMALRRAEELKLGAVRTVSRAKTISLTPAGRTAAGNSDSLTRDIEKRWKARFGAEKVDQLRDSLEGLAGRPDSGSSRLFEGLKPYPDGWRASVPAPITLPHYPMVLHRGGFPDGS